MTPNEQKAVDVLREKCSVRALSAAGLIVTDEDVLNRELAEAMVAYSRCINRQDDISRIDLTMRGPERERVWTALSAIIAARKPKERWTVLMSNTSGALFIMLDGAHSNKSFPRDAEPEARAYVARKNKEDRSGEAARTAPEEAK